MTSPPTRLSVVIPIYNEAATLEQLVESVRQALDGFAAAEIVLVDDGSTDGSAQIVRNLQSPYVRVFIHPSNCGKGAALRTAFQECSGEIVVIQDADLEYDPKDIQQLIQPITEGHADVVYGSRFRGQTQPVHFFWHRLANRWLTSLSNFVTRLDLSDMETGYKAFRKDVLDRIRIRENGFGVEPELTAKVAKMGCRIIEVPISYNGRPYDEGKKIRFRDAVWAVWCVFRYRFAD
jgi:glycosyltransferase involved in cell wall biosynthesis